MSQEPSFTITNFKGNLEYSKERVLKVIKTVGDYTAKFDVQSVDIKFINKFKQWLFVVYLKRNVDMDYFNKSLCDYRAHLAKQIESSLNLHNFNLVLTFA